jgi:hypothetical protein
VNRRDAALVLFVAVTAAEGAATGLRHGTPDAWATGVLAVLVYSALAWLARRGRFIALWATVVVMLVSASRHLMAGGAGMMSGRADLPTDLLRLAAGGALVWAALTVFSGRHRQDRDG